jgi:spoIIIJ-associated protein
MKQVEIKAKTVEEAIQLALHEMGVSRDQVKIEVQNTGNNGILGIMAEQAQIRATLIENNPAADVACNILHNILDLLELNAEITCDCHNRIADEAEMDSNLIVLDINGEDLGILIGRRGQTLAALQYITRLITSQKLGNSVSLALDVNGYKKRRYESLRTLAQHVAEQVAVSHRSFALEPMPAYERRIIHLALSGNSAVTTQSAGFGEARKVVVIPIDKHK